MAEKKAKAISETVNETVSAAASEVESEAATEAAIKAADEEAAAETVNEAVNPKADAAFQPTISTVETAEERQKRYFNERVPVTLIKDGGKYKDDVTVTINGTNYQIRRGETVMVPRKVALVLERSRRQEMQAQQMLDDLIDAKPL